MLRKVSALLLELLITDAMTVLYKIITSHTSISYHRFVSLEDPINTTSLIMELHSLIEALDKVI